MKYSRFELLVLVIGGGAIVATMTAAFLGKSDPVELAGQFLLLAVLVAATHYGRKGGFLAALVATGTYMAMRVPAISSSGGLTPTLAQLLLTRAVVYGAVGIIGGEICSRIKYFFAKLEGRDYIDDITHLYNRTYLQQLVRTQIAQHNRYHATFSLVMLHLDESSLPPLNKSQGRRVVRDVGNALLGDIRLVDEMGRMGGGAFCIVLPNTPLEGARVAAARLSKTAANALRGNRIESGDSTVETTSFGYPENKDAIEQIFPAEPPTGPASS